MVIPFVPSADNSNLSADGDDSFISVDSAMPSPFSEVRLLLDAFIAAVGLPCPGGHCFSWSPPALEKGVDMESIRKTNEDRLASLEPKQGVSPSGGKQWRDLRSRPHMGTGPRAVGTSSGGFYPPSRSPSAVSCTPAPFPPTRAAVTCWSSWMTRPLQPLSLEPPILPLP